MSNVKNGQPVPVTDRGLFVREESGGATMCLRIGFLRFPRHLAIKPLLKAPRHTLCLEERLLERLFVLHTELQFVDN